VAVLWFMIVTPVAIVFAFKIGLVFALCFFGTVTVPCVAVAGARWGVLAGDKHQKIGVPIVGLLLLAFAYWLSTYVSVHVFGVQVSGLILVIISGVIGLIGVPLAWGGRVQGSN
jgi:hypothetical protein